jgi:uncharacterized protein (TIGR03066 family)
MALALALGLFVPALVTNAGEGKKPSDADLTKLLVGKWRFESGEKDLPIRMTLAFAKDKTYSVEAESLQPKYKVKASGTWKVEKGEVVMTTKGSTNRDEVGQVGRTKVISVDGSTLKVPATVIAPAGTPVPTELWGLVIAYKKVK